MMRLSFLTGLILVLTNSACALFINQRTYLIPEGTEGNVYIFRGVASGEKVEKNGNETVFRVPESRILVSQFVPDSSIFQSHFYYVKQDGSRLRLEHEPSSVHKTEENLNNYRPFVWFPAEVSSSWSKVPCEVKYEKFYVGTRARMLQLTQEDRDREWFRLQAFVEENAEKLCEGKSEVKTTFEKVTVNLLGMFQE